MLTEAHYLRLECEFKSTAGSEGRSQKKRGLTTVTCRFLYRTFLCKSATADRMLIERSK